MEIRLSGHGAYHHEFHGTKMQMGVNGAKNNSPSIGVDNSVVPELGPHRYIV